MSQFKNPALKQLTDQQVRFAPPARRTEQLDRARKLLADLEPTRWYPYQFVCYRITDYRPEAYPDLLIRGDDLAHDLAMFVEAVADATPTAAPAEALLTLEELAKRLNVSTRTIRRWRKLGLVGRRICRGGKRQVCYEQAVVDSFLDTNADRVEKGGKFSQMTDAEREKIIVFARNLSQACGATLTDVSRRIAEQTNRSVEAVRYTIRNYDQEHPTDAMFPKLTGPLTPAMKESIYTSYRRGITVNTLAKTYGRTRTSVYRAINEVRAQRLLEQPLDYIPHAEFEDAALESVILAPMPGAEDYEAKRGNMKAPRDVPPELTTCYEVPLLNAEQERHLFRKMNFLKFKAQKIRERILDECGGIDASRVRSQDLNEIEYLQDEANLVKEQLINANMRLVVNIAKRHAGQADNFFELLSDGNMSLIRAVEKFDFGRGFKFSTYASWAIMKNFARTIPDEKHRRERFVTGHEEVFDIAPDTRTDESEAMATKERATVSVNRLLEHLEPREREIIRMRAGLDSHAKGMTLEEIGQHFHITKERVRQLNARAMKKLRNLAEKQELDLS